MKYMGSKIALLSGELGELLVQHARMADGFVDLFAGSGVVSHFVAERVKVAVRSVDLQVLSRPLALSITGRESAILDISPFQHWIKLSREVVENRLDYSAIKIASRSASRASVRDARRLAGEVGSSNAFIMASYGGHYFSLLQAAALDQLWVTRPRDPRERIVAEACIVRVASRCAASPGHTAQPFQPTATLLPSIRDSWSVDVFDECEKQVRLIAPRHAHVAGSAVVSSAIEYAASSVTAEDLVFCDPPYSAAQYSRFYHVLEGIARGGFASVSGAGRAPSRDHRPSSEFSKVGTVRMAFDKLFRVLSSKNVTTILTFPSDATSLSVTGSDVAELAKRHFKLTVSVVAHVHSTLGGSSSLSLRTNGRLSRKSLDEMVLVLKPK